MIGEIKMNFKNEEERKSYYCNEDNCLEIAKKEITKQFPKGEALKSYVIRIAPWFEEQETPDNVHLFLIVYFRLINDVFLALYEIMHDDELIYVDYETKLDIYDEYKTNMDSYEDDGYDYYYTDAQIFLAYARPELVK